MTDKLIMTTEQRDLLLKAFYANPGLREKAMALNEQSLNMLQSLPMVDSQPENNDVVELYGMKDGIQVHLGQAPTPPRMKAKEIVTSVFGHFDEHDDMDDGDAALCFSCMTELIDYMQKLSKPLPKALTPITADDVTDEMIHNWHANTFGAQAMGGVTDREMIVAAVKAFNIVKPRSEAR